MAVGSLAHSALDRETTLTYRSRTFAKGKGEIMSQQEMPQVIGVRHVGRSARGPTALAAFYHDVLGLQVVPTDTSALGPTAFLSGRPAEQSVDLALFANPAFQHTAFEVRTLSDLRAMHQRVVGRGVPVKMALDHGVSLSFYFDDPEGHLIEVYWPTGIACCPRHGEPVDLTLSEDALQRDVPELGQPTSSLTSNGVEKTGVEVTLSNAWDQHLASEFVAKSADQALATMAADPHVNHVPLMIGGRGRD